MNIANTGGTPAPIAASSADGTVRAMVDPDFDSVDTPVPTDAAPADAAFAQVLSQRMGEAKDQGDAAHDASASALAAAIATSAAPDAASAAMTDATPASIATDAKGPDATKDAKLDGPSDAIGNDLAAQLALVSQWTGVATQTSALNASSSTAGRAPSDPLDIAGKLATVRGAMSKGDPATASIDARALDASTKPDIKDRLAIANQANEARANGEPAAQAGGDAARSVEASLALTQSTTLHALPDSSALSTLANALTTHVVAPPTIAPAPEAALPDALRQTVGTPAWAHEVGSAMIRMAVGELQSAALRLNPEHLGPLDVQVRVDNGIAHLAFQAAHTETRQAIEASRPVLEQLFSEQGLKIGNCVVGDSASRNSGFDADRFDGDASSRQHGAGNSASGREPDATEPVVTMRVARAPGRVDTFA